MNKTPVEEYIDGAALDATNPVYFGAEEYWCAMRRLDAMGVSRKYDGEVLSLVGRINWATGTFDEFAN